VTRSVTSFQKVHGCHRMHPHELYPIRWLPSSLLRSPGNCFV
jgi:hypothetical protein